MTRRESIYLDLLRSLASLAVVLDHASSMFRLPHMVHWGHQAVILFFVVSGYVICHVADTRERTAGVFLISRLSRLWSVLLPALVLTVLCDWVGRRFAIYPSAYATVPFDHPAVRLGAMAVFLSESWVSIQPLSDGAAWSLCVEFWYYMMFAAAVFLPPGWGRTAGVATALLLGGHKAILLLPVWLMGVALQRSLALRRLPAAACAALWAATLAIIAWILLTQAYDGPIAVAQRMTSPWLWRQLDEARVFWFDWVFGVLVAGHLLGAGTVAAWLPLERVAGPVRWCAGISFAVYLFHDPLLHLCAAFLPAGQGVLAIALTLGVIAVLGPLAERSKVWWRGWMTVGLTREGGLVVRGR